MIEKRFNSDLYDGEAVDAAVKIYETYGSFELEKASDAWLVRITANEGIDERHLADELGNYALGTTIESRKSSATGDVA